MDKNELKDDHLGRVAGGDGDWVDLPGPIEPIPPVGIEGGKPCPICGSTNTVGVGSKFKCFVCNNEFTV